MKVKGILKEAKKLSVDQRIRLAEELWDSVEDGWSDPALPAWQKKELERRIQAHRQNPDDVVSWEAVKEKMSKRARSKR